MDTLIGLLQERKKMLEALIPRLRLELKKMPEGVLNISKSNTKIQYYHIFDKDGEKFRQYIPAKNRKLSMRLGQKAYIENLIAATERELFEIQSILKRGLVLSSDQVYSKLSEERKNLVTPYMLDENAYAELWQNKPFEPSSHHPEGLIYPTKRGEMVRSKSEAIFADSYHDMGIPYKYECPITLHNGMIFHPDFTLLHKASRREFYHEHLGRLDDPAYLLDSMQRLDLFRENGIFVGKNLILTHEIEGSPLNIRLFRQNMAELFGLFNA